MLDLDEVQRRADELIDGIRVTYPTCSEADRKRLAFLQAGSEIMNLDIETNGISDGSDDLRAVVYAVTEWDGVLFDLSVKMSAVERGRVIGKPLGLLHWRKDDFGEN